MVLTTCPNCGFRFDDGSEILRCPKCCYTKEFMEYDEFARLLGVSIWSIRRLVKAGRIKATNLSIGRNYIHRSEFNRLAGLTPENTPI